jgi:predicted ArsR family transcriptional regulator
MHPTDLDHHLTSLASLGDPLRRTLYRYVTNHDHPVSRDDAATATGISRPLAAYHLDKLVHDGLLEARYQHRSPRRGPGAGRPAKHYVRAPTPIELSLPTRDYATLADLLADAIDADPTGTAQAALHRAAATLATQTTQATHPTPGATPTRPWPPSTRP